MGRRHLLIVDDEIMKQERSETKTVVGFFDILGYEKLVHQL